MTAPAQEQAAPSQSIAKELRSMSQALASAADAADEGLQETALRDLADVEQRIRALGASDATSEGAGDATTYVHSLAELLTDPDLIKAPEAVVQPFGWRGRMTLLAAREKAGKSTLMGHLGARVSRANIAFPGAPQ